MGRVGVRGGGVETLLHRLPTTQGGFVHMRSFGFYTMEGTHVSSIFIRVNSVYRTLAFRPKKSLHWHHIMSLSDQRWSLASDPLHLSDPGTNLTPHSGCVRPTDSRTWCRLPPGGRTCVLLIDPWKGAVMWPHEGRWTWWWCIGITTGDPSVSLHYTCIGRKKDGAPEECGPLKNQPMRGAMEQ